MVILILYRIYQIFIAAPILLVATIITALLTSIGSILFGGNWWGYLPPHIWARLFCILSMVKVEVRGMENVDKKTSYVFIANHQGTYDIFAIYGYLNHNFKWMMKESLQKIPLVGRACKNAGHIMVDRTNPTGIRRTMDDAKKRLRNGMSLVVFPEGSRTKTGYMTPFKKGAFLLASQFGLPLVPLTIDGSFDVMSKEQRIPIFGRIIMTIHKPITDIPSPLSKAMEETHSIVNSKLTKYKL